MEIVNLLTWILLGIPLMMTYSMIDNSFWVSINKNKSLYIIYLVCLVLAFISGILMVVWSTKYELSDKSEKNLLTIGIVILVGFSILWVPMFQQSKKDSKYKYFTVFALMGAAAGSMIIAHTVLKPVIYNKTKDLKYSVLWAIPALFLVFQTTIMDLIVWNLFYFKNS